MAPTHDQASDRRVVLVLASITVMGAVLRLWSLDDQSIWLDEAITASHLNQSFSGMLSSVSSTDATPPLYFIVGWLWAHLFGTGEIALRSLPALAGIATIPAAFLAGRELFSPRAGLIGAALVATNPLLIHYSQEARAYSLMLFLTAVALVGFAHVLRTPSRGAWMLWLVGSLLAIASNYVAAFAMAPLAAWLLIRSPTRSTFRWVGAFGLICGAAIPVVAASHASDAASLVASIPMWSRIQQIAQSPLVGDSGSPVTRKVWAVALIALAALAVYGLWRPSPSRRDAIMLASVGAATLALPVVAAAAGVDIVLARYLQTAWLPLILVLAAALAKMSSPLARIIAAGTTLALCSTGLLVAATEARDQGRKRDDWRTYVPFVEKGAVSPSAIVLAPAYDDVAFRYYAPHAHPLPDSGARVREIDVMFVVPHGGSAPALRVVGPSSFVAGYPPASRITVPRGFAIRSARMTGRLVLVRLVASSPRHITAATVRQLTFSKTSPRVLLNAST